MRGGVGCSVALVVVVADRLFGWCARAAALRREQTTTHRQRCGQQLPQGRDRYVVVDAATSRFRRRELRRHATDAEHLLWWRLRARQLEGAKFRRQHPVGPYFVDFYCAEHGLAVELDGGQHFSDEGKAYDERRTSYLVARGLRVIRFSNAEVFEELEGVVEAIRQALCPSPAGLRPATSPRWRGAR